MKARFTTVADWAVCASDGIIWLELLPLPNKAVPTTAMPMAAPSRCPVISVASAVPACWRSA
jgi:hypothetical protein